MSGASFHSTSKSISTKDPVNWAYLLPICMTATLGGLLFGYDTGVISGAIEPLQAHFHLTPFMKGWVSAIILLGCAIGVLIVGPISDKYGRRFAMLLSAIMFLAAAIGTALPKTVEVLLIFRVIGGLGVGMASIVTPVYISEIAPARVRGSMVAANQIAIVVGIACTAFLNFYIAGQGDAQWLQESGWRWMFAAGIAPAIIFGFLLLFIPESPRWLLKNNQEEKAKKIMTRVSDANFAATESQGVKSALTHESGTLKDLLAPGLRITLYLGIALAILQQVTGVNAFMYFGPTIFRSLSESANMDSGLLQQIVITATGVVFTLGAIFTVDKLGRKPLMLIGSAGMFAALIGMGILAQTMTNAAEAGVWMLALILLYYGCFSFSVGPVVWIILAEIYPTKVRGTAFGVAAFFLWLADYIVTQTYPMFTDKDSWFVAHFKFGFPFYLYSIFCIIMFLVIWRKTPETKGRTLEEIEKFWKRT